MARMYPQRLPGYVRSNPLRSAECRVYDELERQLDDSFCVYYSSPWLGTTESGEERDGEADFTIAHVEHGILIVEVKGGRVRRESDTRQWYSRNREGIEFKIKDPVRQAREGKHNLLKALKNRREWTERFINARHGVILTDTVRPGHDLGPDMPLRLFAFSEDIGYLKEWVDTRFGCQEGEHGPANVQPLGLPGMKALEAMLFGGFQLAVDMRAYLDSDVDRIDVLSDEQYAILEEMEENRRMAIAGAAGTGKTVLAAHKAVLESRKGHHTLLVCYNEPLAGYLRSLLAAEDGLDVRTYHSLCESFTLESGHSAPTDESRDQEYFNHALPELYVDALSKLPERRFDAIVIDEGQDFQDKWLETLELSLRNGDQSTYYVFYDDNQRVSNRAQRYISGMSAARRRLRRNFRNTRRIFELSSLFYSGLEVVAIGPVGEPIAWLEAANRASAEDRLRERIGSLLTSGIRPSRIAVICSSRRAAQQAEKCVGSRLIKTVDASNRTDNAVAVDSVRRFKGLEADVVIMFMPDPYVDDMEMLYVATTRAKALLFVIGSRASLSVLRRDGCGVGSAA